MLLAMAIVMLQPIALVFQRTERLILDFPPRPSATHHRLDIGFAQGNIGHPTPEALLAVLDLPVLQKVYLQIRMRLIGLFIAAERLSK